MKKTGFPSLPENKVNNEYIEILRSKINNSDVPYVEKLRLLNELPIPPPPRKGGRRTNKRRTEKKQRKSSKKRKNKRRTKKSNKK